MGKHGKRGGHEEEAGGEERWLVSYADFLTLLFVLFVVLYSMGQVDVEKYKILAESMRAAFSTGGATKKVSSSISSGSGGTDPNGSADVISIPDMPEKPAESEDVAYQLTELLNQMNITQGVSVQTNIEGTLMSFSENLLFYSGTVTLFTDAYPNLDIIVQLLNSMDNNVRIVGHTDNSSSQDSRYATNLELSTGRAMVVAQYLINAGIDPSRLSISGNGEYSPVFSNDTEEHIKLNNRVEIIIIYPDTTSSIILD